MKIKIDFLLERLVMRNGIHLDQNELKLQLSSHPSYPSLHALTGALDHFGVSNLALQLPIENAILAQLPAYFLAQIESDKKKSLVLVEKQKVQFKITHEDKKTERLSEAEFLATWDGIVLAIEKDEKIKERRPSFLVKFHRWSLIAVALLALSFLIFILPDAFAKLHFFASVVGLILSVFIVRHELGLQSSLVNSICNLSSATSCDAVLGSSGAVIFGQLKLSDLSIFTFSSFLLFWSLSFTFGISNYSPIVLVTALAIPVTLFSLYYQHQVVQKWCPLCLGIVAVLWIQAAALLSIDFFALEFSILEQSTFLLLLSALIVSGIWNFTRPLWKRKIELEELEVEHYKFKRNFSVFESLHRQSKPIYPPKKAIEDEIILGDKTAPLELVLITSPSCRYCKQVHHDLERLLDQSKGRLKARIRFHVGQLDASNEAYQIAIGLLRIYNESGEEACKVAMHEVFAEQADHKQWLQENDITASSKYHDMLHAQLEWFRSNGVNFTPDVYLGGKQIPPEYNCAEVVHFIDDIIERQRENDAKRLSETLLPKNIFREG